MIRQRCKTAILVGIATILALSLATPIILSRAGGQYDLSWWTTYAGGEASSGGEYAMNDTLGQAFAGSSPSLHGQRWSLTDGFWWASSTGTTVYLPVVVHGEARL